MTALSSSFHEGRYYHLRALLDIPRRLFRPPDPGVGRVGRVSQLSLTPVYEVKLEDVLAEKHLPPLTLIEFEAYLVYTERSPENLHFILWFRDYEKRYKRWTQSPLYPRQSASLAASFSRAREAFFTPSSSLELNLPAETLAIFRDAVPRAHPTPSYFADIRHQVDEMLKESLGNFVRSRSRNSGKNRGMVAIIGGLCVMCLGLVPILLSVIGGRSKWLRFAAFPLFWFGCTAIVCGLHGLCLLIYIFGDARQLTVYELARPRSLNKTFTRNNITPLNGISQVSSRRMSSVDYIQFSPPKSRVETAENIELEPPKRNISPVIQTPPPHVVDMKFPYEAEHAFPAERQSFPDVIAPFLSMPDSPAETTFDFDQLPSRISYHLEKDPASSPPVITLMATVLDRISIRMYWDTFARSAFLAFLVACTLVGISFSST